MTDSESALVSLLKKRLNLLTYTSLDENKYNQTYFKHAGLMNVDIRSYQLHGIRWLIERYETGHGTSERLNFLLGFILIKTISRSSKR
jgi:hypothetical protein